MNAKPSPKRLDQPFQRHAGFGSVGSQKRAIRMVENHRMLECDQYDGCLTRAANDNWPGFSCRGCKYEGAQE